MTQRVTGYWPLLAGLGVANVLVGLASVIWPGVTVLVLALLLGLALILTGAGALSFGARLRRAGLAGGPAMVLGALTAAAGVVVLAHPGTGAKAIVLACAFWFLLSGFGALGMASRQPDHRIWFGFVGALSTVAGLVLIVDRSAGVVTVSLVVGFGFLVLGMAELAIAQRLRRLAQIDQALTVRRVPPPSGPFLS